MVYKRYYSPFEDRPNPNLHMEVVVPKKADPPCDPDHRHKQQKRGSSPLDFLTNVQLDDLLLIAVLILLLTEEQEQRDIPLILTIGFLLLIGYIDKP